jgi:bacterioferritin-associated ferredoxin
MYVCLCKQLTESDVLDVARAGHRTPQALISALGLEDAACCGRCAREVDDLLPLVASASAACSTMS